jgi:transposase
MFTPASSDRDVAVAESGMINLGRPKTELVLTNEERERLTSLAARRKSAQALAQRARIVLRCAEGMTNTAVAGVERVTMQTVGKWRRRFVQQRLAGLADAARCGAPRTLSDAQVEGVIIRTLESKPKHATHWSTRSMAKRCGLTHDAIHRIWKTFGLKPHRAEVCQLSTDPFFIDKVRDVVGLYLNPPEQALVLCVDEKSQCQALERSQPLLPLGPGRVERSTHDYFRHGTVSLFAALDVQTGKVIGHCQARHTQRQFLDFLQRIGAATPPHLALHLVLDNYATHKTPAVRRWLVRHPRFHLHFIPTHSSWLNQVERWFAKITTEAIRRGSFRSVPHLRQTIMDYIAANNRQPQPFVWTAPADLILGKVAHLCGELV